MNKPSQANNSPSMDLTGKAVLIVEDEFLVADEMSRNLRNRGAEVVGPVASLAAAQKAIANVPKFDGAILDINLRGAIAFELIDTLRTGGVPCVLVTGYDVATVPAAYQDVPFRQKPVETVEIVKALFG